MGEFVLLTTIASGVTLAVAASKVGMQFVVDLMGARSNAAE